MIFLFNKLEFDLSDKFRISRDNSKKESKQSRKRPLNQCNENPERREAVKYLNKAGGTRRDALLKYVTQDEVSDKRKKMDSLQCKKTKLHRKKSNQTSVSRPVAAGISR